MEKLYTSAQMAVLIGVSERSIQRWIQEGRLQATRLEDSALYSVQQEDLERLRFRKHAAEEDRMQALERHSGEHDQRIEQLEEALQLMRARLDQQDDSIRILSEQAQQLQTTLDALGSTRKPVKTQKRVVGTTTAETRHTATTDETEELVLAVPFALEHGITKNTAHTAFKRQAIKTTKIEGDNRHYLNKQQQQAALDYWRDHSTPGFHE
jgi:excisionase family DNA binding protein